MRPNRRDLKRILNAITETEEVGVAKLEVICLLPANVTASLLLSSRFTPVTFIPFTVLIPAVIVIELPLNIPEDFKKSNPINGLLLLLPIPLSEGTRGLSCDGSDCCCSFCA